MLSCRLDAEATTVAIVDRHGAWCVFPGPAGEHEAIELALQEAQQRLHSAASTDAHLAEARDHADTVLRRLTKKDGWTVRVARVE